MSTRKSAGYSYESAPKRAKYDTIKVDDDDIIDITGSKPVIIKATPKAYVEPTKEKEKASPSVTASLPSASQFEQIEDQKPLGAEQDKVLKAVMSGQNVFFTGSAGTGKSFVLKRIRAALERKYPRQAVWVTATTGIAAVNVGGVTIHSWSGVGIEDKSLSDEENFSMMLGRAFGKRKRWHDTKVLIIDEISMMSGKFLDMLEHFARKILKMDKPFGGIQLVLCGDFFQLPPVSTNEGTAFSGEAWKKLKLTHLQLTKVFRQEDEEFVTLLNEVRMGKCSQKTIDTIKSCSKELDQSDGIEPTQLLSVNDAVNRVNDNRLAQLTTKEVTYQSEDYESGRFPILKTTCLVQEVVSFKIGAQVMLLRNLSDHLVNGSRGKIVGFKDGSVELNRDRYFDNLHMVENWTAKTHKKQFASRELSNLDEKVVLLPVVQFTNGMQITIYPEAFSVNTTDASATRVQLPLKLAWALTIHKCQGLTLDKVHIDLSGIFADGQAYVALSRARTIEGLRITGFKPDCIRTNAEVIKFHNTMFNKG